MKDIVYNWHITERCNYSCVFCFAKWKERKPPEICHDNEAVSRMFRELSKKDAAAKMTGARVAKVRINFAGGEPLLLGRRFISIVKRAKKMEFETSIITNGYLLDRYPEIFKYLDIIGISVDSLDGNICKKIGRCLKSGRSPAENYLSVEKLTKTVAMIRQINPKAKIKFNTVVSEHNYDANIAEQLQAFKPDRLKILRQLPFNGEKGISDEQWKRFLAVNEKAASQENAVIEDKDDITHSYLMIDPQGRFFQNGDERGYSYSQPIHDVGLERALSQIPFDRKKFDDRYKTKKITLSGYAGTGKSTVGKILAEKLGCAYFSAGDSTRKFAEEKYGMSINEFQAKCGECPELDVSLNHNFRDVCNNAESIVADFRLGFHFVESAFNILFIVSEQEAFERLSAAGRRMEQTDFESIRKRNEGMRNRFIERFGVDFADESNYDLIIDTGGKTADETTAQILAAIRD